MATSPWDILWAEDNLQDQVLIRSALEDLRPLPRVEFADDGVILLEKLARGLPRLVVLDLKMPRVGGLEALRRIRETPAWSPVPVAVFSAGDDRAEGDACRDLGALRVVQKPVNFEAFTQAARSVVALASGPP